MDSKQLFVSALKLLDKGKRKEKEKSLPNRAGTRIKEISSDTGNSGQYVYSIRKILPVCLIHLLISTILA
jgi:hypothetical protein